MSKDINQHIIEEIKKGDQDAFLKVYQAYRDPFLKFAYKYNVKHADALDLYQDTILAFRDNIVTGRLTVLNSSVSTYLHAIGKNKIYKHHRDQAKQVSMDYVNPNEINFEIDVNFNPESLTKQQQLYKKCFEKLGKRCKEILNLHLYRGFTLDEIVEHLEYSDKKVLKSQKSRCIKQLKDLIKQSL